MIWDLLMTDRVEGQWCQSGDKTSKTQQKCGIWKGVLSCYTEFQTKGYPLLCVVMTLFLTTHHKICFLD